MSFFGGRKAKMKQVPTKTPQQMDFLSQMLQSLMGGTGGQGQEAALQHLMGLLSGSPESFQAIEAPARRGFEQQTIPGILERFSGGGAGRSSGLQQTLGAAGQELETGLAAQRGQMQQDAVKQLLANFLGQSQLGLGTQTFENVMQPGRGGFLQSLLGGMSGGFGQFGQGAGQAAGSAWGRRFF